MKRKKEDLKQLPLKVNSIISSGNIVCEHWHSHIELIMLLSGQAVAVVGKNKIYIKKGDVIFINRALLHSVFADQKCHLLGFVIPSEKEITKFPINLQYNPVINHDAVSKLLIMLYEEYSSGDYAILKAYVDLLTKLISREILPAYISQSDSDIIAYINNHYFGKISIEDIARGVNLSKYYLLHSFKKQYGITVNNYLTNFRIERALEMLNENVKTAEIAEKCGFSDNGYFCKVFKKVMGISVRDYRKLNK